MINSIKLLFLLFCFSFTSKVYAEWKVVTHNNIDSGSEFSVAHTENEAGYIFEIYRDENDVIRSRFRLNKMLDNLKDKSCPTYQVDDRGVVNHSVNDAKCISSKKWAEFILGYIVNNQVKATSLHNIMNGNTINYRFMLEYGGYEETTFSLNGSKRILSRVLGNNLTVITDTGFSN